MTMTQHQNNPALSTLSSKNLADALRILAVDMVEKAQSGHPGLPLGMADVATILWTEFLTIHPTDPQWFNRDRFILSAGHGSALLYALLYLSGFKEMDQKQIQSFRQSGSLTPGHPEHGHTPGIDMTTGPLGQGIASAVGMAYSEKLLSQELGPELCSHHTYVIVSDGDLMEGINHEALSFAGHHQLHKLIVLFDDNGISIDGPTSLSTSDDHCARMRSYGFETYHLDGHDHDAIRMTLQKAQDATKPVFIACRTTIGFGAPTKAGTASVHGSPLGAQEIQELRQALNWPWEPFDIPVSFLDEWRSKLDRCQERYIRWTKNWSLLSSEKQKSLQSGAHATTAFDLSTILNPLKEKIIQEKPSKGTRILSHDVLEILCQHIPQLIGGSADLTPSNNTKTKTLGERQHYVHYGVREHAMGAMMNGIALHGGLIPYGGTFLVFSDYMRPAIRLSALMRQRVIYVLTHDSIGLGEDGPTHQPVEHLASLRAIPHLQVLRPCDGIEVAECWELALHYKGPTVIALSRQNVPTLRSSYNQNESRLGGYILHDVSDPHMVLVATGSEVSLAMDVAKELLDLKGWSVRIVSMPSRELFEQQSQSYHDRILPQDLPCVVIEAGCRQGWDRYFNRHGLFFGVNDFGLSAPYQDVYKHFGLTKDAIVQKILAKFDGGAHF